MTAGLYASEPPPGQERHVSDPPNRRKEIVVVGTIALAIGVTALGLRIFTRVHILRKRVKLDDYFVMLAMICAVIAFIMTLEQLNHGLSYHKWDVLWDEYANGYALYAVIETCFYTLSVGFAKLSILCFYLQLSPEEWFRWSTVGLIGAVAVFSITYACVNLFPCQPVAASWNFNIEGPHHGAAEDIADRALRGRRHLTRTRNPSVCAITIARASIIPSLKASLDRPWDVAIDYQLAFLEMNIGIVCASVPALKPFFIRYLPSLVSSHLSSSSANKGRGGGGLRRRRPACTTSTPSGSGSATLNSSKKGTFLSSIGRSWAGGVDDHDDETRLWPSSHRQHSKENLGALDGDGTTTTTRTVDLETVSASTIEALHGGGAVHTASVSVDGSQTQSGRLGAGISVLKETSVSYEQ
ncbi:Satratoxin biosynthesis SC1 cluster protein 4 [Apiospora aurea]|uniref:Satratoxin biosynthesis SC1 cluster protein 4 n=1 Tax=Apiospora aurea TaxID=335848 RepID=A0ABR1QZW4_9PEZI